MLLLDIFKRKKKLESLFRKSWQRIDDEIIYPDVVEDDPPQKIIFFGLLTYATIYESALKVGMEPSTGHYLARIQLGKYKLGDEVTRIVETTFSGLDTEEQKSYAEFFLGRVERIVGIVADGDGEIKSLLQELAAAYRAVPLAPE